MNAITMARPPAVTAGTRSRPSPMSHAAVLRRRGATLVEFMFFLAMSLAVASGGIVIGRQALEQLRTETLADGIRHLQTRIRNHHTTTLRIEALDPKTPNLREQALSSGSGYLACRRYGICWLDSIAGPDADVIPHGMTMAGGGYFSFLRTSRQKPLAIYHTPDPGQFVIGLYGLSPRACGILAVHDRTGTGRAGPHIAGARAFRYPATDRYNRNVPQSSLWFLFRRSVALDSDGDGAVTPAEAAAHCRTADALLLYFLR